MSIQHANSDGILWTTPEGLIVLQCRQGVPPGSVAGYIKWAMYIRQNGNSTTTTIYFNSGTKSSSTWTALTIA